MLMDRPLPAVTVRLRQSLVLGKCVFSGHCGHDEHSTLQCYICHAQPCLVCRFPVYQEFTSHRSWRMVQILFIVWSPLIKVVLGKKLIHPKVVSVRKAKKRFVADKLANINVEVIFYLFIFLSVNCKYTACLASPRVLRYLNIQNPQKVLLESLWLMRISVC